MTITLEAIHRWLEEIWPIAKRPDAPRPVTGLAAKYGLPRRVGGADNFLELTDDDLEKWAKEIEADERMRAMG